MFLEVIIIVFLPSVALFYTKSFQVLNLFSVSETLIDSKEIIALLWRFQVLRQRCTAFTRNIGVSFKVCKENQFLLVPLLSKLTI